MNATTLAILTLADTMKDYSRDVLIQDLAEIIANRKFFTAEQVAERYSVTKASLKNWRAEGKIAPSLRIPGGTVRYTLEDLLKFESQTGKSPE